MGGRRPVWREGGPKPPPRTIPGSPARPPIKPEGGTLYFPPGGGNAVPLEATAENKFKMGSRRFLRVRRRKGRAENHTGRRARVFTKEK